MIVSPSVAAMMIKKRKVSNVDLKSLKIISWISKKYDILYVGKHKWLNRRKDGATEFHVTKETVAHFQELEARQFDGITDDDRVLCHGLFGDEDTLVGPESRAVFEAHYPGMAHSFPGGHQLNSEVLANTLVPYIRSLNVI